MAPKKLTSEPTSSSLIITTKECHRALQFFQDGNHSEALKLARYTASRHPNSSLSHSTLAAIHFGIAQSSNARKREHIASAISSERAVALSPNSISLSLFHAILLFKLAQEDEASSTDYEPVIKECERALCIENPMDPLENNLDMDMKENDLEDSTVELRIGRVKRNLKELLKEAKIQQLKKVVDDNSFAEISKDIQAIQDRKAEIQTKFFTAKLSFERKLISKVDTRAEDYWNNVMSLEAKKELLSVGFEDLNAHFNKNKSLAAKAKEVLAEAVECLKLTKNWKFSECCHCGERFFNWESHKEHVESVHLGTLSEELQLVVQERMRPNLVHETIILDGWKPVDMVVAVKLMEDLARNGSGDLKTENWPYCDNKNRYTVIRKIQETLKLYLAIRCFTMSLFNMLMHMIRVVLENRIPEPVLERLCSNKTLQLICFLEEPQLKHIHKFLEENLDIPCGLSLYNSSEADEARGDLKSSYERIFISNNFSCLVFDQRMLHGLILPGIDEIGNVDESKNDGKEDIEAILYWLFAGSPTLFREKLKGWTRFREASKNQGMEYFKIMQTEFCQIHKMCERRRDLLGYQKSWHNLRDICCEEEKRRNEIPGYNPQSYKSLLLKRKKEIEAEKGDEEMDSFGFELDNIICILRKEQADSKIQELMRLQINQMAMKLLKLNTIIMMINTAMQHTWKKIEMVTTYDYRSIVVPLLKSFMQAQLEDMVDKDAAEKSNAALEALLSELALNDKNIKKGGNDARKGQGKLKDKKKKKNHKKAKEFKVTGGSEEQQENVEQTSFPVAHGEDYPPNPEIVGLVTNDELEKEEWELKAEEEYRMLEMNLELQMQIEYEAKQKRLAELNKVETSAGNVAEDVPSKGINFGTFGWTDFDQDQGVRSDEKSSEPEQEKHPPKTPEAE
uniref:C2H2-type domain-containing protein n=1 Tax=Fagus sylvatica TaxID=28930 RepID=A0A2N9EWY8_FAGSY